MEGLPSINLWSRWLHSTSPCLPCTVSVVQSGEQEESSEELIIRWGSCDTHVTDDMAVASSGR